MEVKKYTDEKYVDEIFQKIYPIGSIYMSMVETNPSILFGFGTWERIQDRFLLAAGSVYTAGTTGGEATHKLTTNEMPKHFHDNAYTDDSLTTEQTTKTNAIFRSALDVATNIWRTTQNKTILEAGNGAAHNNMPPYLVVYIWKRIN